MEISDEYRIKLIKKYRIPFFENVKRTYSDMRDKVPEEDLPFIIKINNDDMEKMILEDDVDEVILKKLFYANLNFYTLANYQKLSIPGMNTMFMAATKINQKQLYKYLKEISTQSDISPFKRK